MKHPSLTLLAAAVAFVVMAFSTPTPSKATFGFGYYGPGVGIYVGPRPYYRPYYDRPYYYPRAYYRPYRYYRGPVYGGGRCVRWGQRCRARWGIGNYNFRGCMRYHRC